MGEKEKIVILKDLGTGSVACYTGTHHGKGTSVLSRLRTGVGVRRGSGQGTYWGFQGKASLRFVSSALPPGPGMIKTEEYCPLGYKDQKEQGLHQLFAYQMCACCRGWSLRIH